jgi:pimeloyl-ACP methyl ester carboxylesterase
MGDEPPPAPLPREPEHRAWKVEPAPVGLHLHCWGGSLNGGYGWWYNAHRGAVLIASNQVPYDWWTGYHERRGTARTFGDGRVQPFSMNRMFGFLGWASKQWQESPAPLRTHWRQLDLTRVFTAGSSMGGAGAPMFAVRGGDRVAWCVAWVGVHVPELSPQFRGSYEGSYGPRDAAVTMPDGRTSPWDWFSDVWWLRNNIKAETGFIMASNGKDDGGIGWRQAWEFARALQETRRPHLFNWGMSGHGTRTLVGANFDLDVRTDQSLPAFTNGTLDGNLGTGILKTKEEMEAERNRLAEEATKAGKDPKQVRVCPTDGDPEGAFNAHLGWRTDDVVDTPGAWEMTVILKESAPKDSCRVDLTPRRLQRFRTPAGAKFRYTVTDVAAGKVLAEGSAVADPYALVTLKQIPLVKGKNRVRIVPEK